MSHLIVTIQQNDRESLNNCLVMSPPPSPGSSHPAGYGWMNGGKYRSPLNAPSTCHYYITLQSIGIVSCRAHTKYKHAHRNFSWMACGKSSTNRVSQRRYLCGGSFSNKSIHKMWGDRCPGWSPTFYAPIEFRSFPSPSAFPSIRFWGRATLDE